MAAVRTSLQEEKCLFCLSTENNELLYGAKKRLNNVVTHYYCLLLSSSMEQKGEDTDGLLGFMLPDIQKELNRGKRLICTYCKRSGATIGCVNGKCRKNFHLPCGIAHGSLHQFFTQFKSFCHDHRPRQKIPVNILREIEGSTATCAICYEEVSREPGVSTIWAPCCKKSAWFHRECVQRLANSAGYFFKCPLCNNKKEFCKAMQECGIYIPEQDASWETVPNAFEELLHRHNRCDHPHCRNPKGRTNDEKGTRFELILCELCGSQGVHMACAALKWSNPEWECADCRTMLKDAEGRRDNEGPSADEPGENSSSSSSIPSRRPTPNATPSPNEIPPTVQSSPPPPRLHTFGRVQTAKRGRSSGVNLGSRPSPVVAPRRVSAGDVIEILSDSDDEIEIIELMETEKPMELIMSDGSKIPIVQVLEESTAPIVVGDVNVVDYNTERKEPVTSFSNISQALAQRKVDIKPVLPPKQTPCEVIEILDDLELDTNMLKSPRRSVARDVVRSRKGTVQVSQSPKHVPARRSLVDIPAQETSRSSTQNPQQTPRRSSVSSSTRHSSTVTSGSYSRLSAFDQLLGPARSARTPPRKDTGLLANILNTPVKETTGSQVYSVSVQKTAEHTSRLGFNDASPNSNDPNVRRFESSYGQSLASSSSEYFIPAKKSRPSELSYELESNLGNYRQLLPISGNMRGNPPSYEETMITDQRQNTPNTASSYQHASCLQQYPSAQQNAANSNVQLSGNLMSYQNQGVMYNSATSFVASGPDSPANVIYQGGTTYVAVSSNPTTQVQGFLMTQPHVLQSYVPSQQKSVGGSGSGPECDAVQHADNVSAGASALSSTPHVAAPSAATRCAKEETSDSIASEATGWQSEPRSLDDRLTVDLSELTFRFTGSNCVNMLVNLSVTNIPLTNPNKSILIPVKPTVVLPTERKQVLPKKRGRPSKTGKTVSNERRRKKKSTSSGWSKGFIQRKTYKPTVLNTTVPRSPSKKSVTEKKLTCISVFDIACGNSPSTRSKSATAGRSTRSKQSFENFTFKRGSENYVPFLKAQQSNLNSSLLAKFKMSDVSGKSIDEPSTSCQQSESKESLVEILPNMNINKSFKQTSSLKQCSASNVLALSSIVDISPSKSETSTISRDGSDDTTATEDSKKYSYSYMNRETIDILDSDLE